MIWWVFALFLFVPLLVHLFDFRKAKRIYFSTIKYISNLSSKTKSTSRLKYLAVLGNRLLIFGCILISIWHLVSDKEVKRTGPVSLYFDNSVSSTINDGAAILYDLVQDLTNQNQKPIHLISNIDNQSIASVSDFGLSSSYSSKSLNSVVEYDMAEYASNNNILLSDFQRVNTQDLKSILIDSTKQYRIILLNKLSEHRNLAVDSLWLQTNPNDLSELTVYVDFVKYNMASGSVVVKLMQGSRQLSSIVKEIGELDVLEFDIPMDAYGQYSLQIDGDEVTYDNQFFFVREVKNKPVISVLNNEGGRAIEEVFNNSSLFDTKILNTQNLDYERLEGSDLIVFNNFFELPINLIEQFDSKYLLIFPPDSIDGLSYSGLDGMSFSQNSSDPLEIDIIPGNDLMRGVFDENTQPGTMPKLSPAFHVKGSFEPIINFRDGSPFLFSTQKNYIFNTSLNNSQGFESNALFLPVLYQIAFTSAGGIEAPYVYPGNSIKLDVPVTDIPIKLVGEGFEVIPDFSSIESKTTLSIPNDVKPGIYHLIREEDTLQHLAINIPENESVMIAPSLEDLERAFEQYDNVTVSQVYEGAENTVFASSESVGLWKYALILALILILTETMLHRFLK
ncbi:BatA domain-containing protein [Ekhidna sp.]|uniref:BatA domain-containing protein n=1 Tax=Ekhidna sp. TaxID=2608089 RepID=UPI003B593C0C